MYATNARDGLSRLSRTSASGIGRQLASSQSSKIKPTSVGWGNCVFSDGGACAQTGCYVAQHECHQLRLGAVHPPCMRCHSVVVLVLLPATFQRCMQRICESPCCREGPPCRLTAGQAPSPFPFKARHSRSWALEGASPIPEVSLIHIHAMGEAEAPAPVEEPQVADGAVAVEISEGANAKGEGPSKPPKRLPKPNKEEMLAKANVLHETIKARKARIEEINSIISGKNRQSESPELVQLKNKLLALRAQWDAELVCLAFLASQFVTTYAASFWPPSRACMLASRPCSQCMSPRVA